MAVEPWIEAVVRRLVGHGFQTLGIGQETIASVRRHMLRHGPQLRCGIQQTAAEPFFAQRGFHQTGVPITSPIWLTLY